MSMLDRIRDSFKYLDKNGLKHLIEKIKAHDVHWTGTHAEYEVVKDTLPDYTILHFTDDYDENVKVGIYSTEETKTGEMFLNKPVYRKVFTGLSVTVNQGSDWRTVCSVPDSETLVKYNIKAGSFAADWSANALCRLLNGSCQLYNCSGLNMTVIGIIIEYTKTTD